MGRQFFFFTVLACLIAFTKILGLGKNSKLKYKQVSNFVYSRGVVK